MGNPVTHFEIVGKDAQALQDFYREAFGWGIQPAVPGYAMVHPHPTAGIPGGVGVAPEGSGSSRVTVYVEVEDPAAALDRVEELGGKALLRPVAVPGGPVFALFADPEGHVVGLVRRRPGRPALGGNVHLFARPHRRPQLVHAFETALGCGPVRTVTWPGIPQPMVVVVFPGGGSLSIEFRDDAEDSEQPRLATWLELRAPDPVALLRAAEAAGLRRVLHPGHEHYVMLPGGQVLALMPADAR